MGIDKKKKEGCLAVFWSVNPMYGANRLGYRGISFKYVRENLLNSQCARAQGRDDLQDYDAVLISLEGRIVKPLSLTCVRALGEQKEA